MNQTIGVNITPQSFQPTLHFSQGDVGRVFVINVTDYDIPSGATVTCVATKPSGMGFTVSGTVSGNSVTFTSTAEMTDEWGRFPAEIRIASGDTLLGTANFLMIGEKNPHPASTIDGTQEELIPQLTLLVNRVEAAAESVHDLTVSATTLAAGSDATATYDSTNNSIEFGIPRGADGDVTRSEFNDLKSDLTSFKGEFPHFLTGTVKTYNSVSSLYMSNVDNCHRFVSGGSSLVVYYIPVIRGEKYKVYCENHYLFSDDYVAVGFSKNVPASDGLLTVITMGTTATQVVNTEYEVKEDGYLCMQKSRASTSYYFVKVESDVNLLSNYLVKTYDYTETSGYFASNGTIVSAGETTKEVYTDKLSVLPDEKIQYSFKTTDEAVKNLWMACMYYDKSENIVGSRVALVNEYNGFAGGIITIPEGVYYVAFTYRTYGTLKGLTVDGCFTFDFIKGLVSNIGDNKQIKAVDFVNSTIKSINHRGYNQIAPENTLPAFKLSKENGFDIVETDVRFTSDNVPVLLHDTTVDRTSNGGGAISEMTYAQARALDFGSWKSETYSGTTIPSFEEFLTLCKRINLYAYCELETPMTQANIESLISIAKNCGMLDKITWISFSTTLLSYVISAYSSARIGVIYSSGFDANAVKALETGLNEVFVDHDITTLTNTIIADCIDNELPIEVWTIDTEAGINNLDVYVSGVTSDNLIAEKVMYDSNIN